MDLGLSLQLAHAHTLDVNLYRRDTKDALIMTDIPASNGFLSMLDNVGSLRNEGVELSASSRLRVSNAALRTIDKVGIDVVLADLRARGEA